MAAVDRGRHERDGQQAQQDRAQRRIHHEKAEGQGRRADDFAPVQGGEAATSRMATTSRMLRVRMKSLLGLSKPFSAVGGAQLSAKPVSLCDGCGKLARFPLFPSSNTMQKILRQIAAELRVQESQVRAAVELLDGGASVPFIARYRKEATGGLDDIHLRELEARLATCASWKSGAKPCSRASRSRAS
jgi:hypothetical protein